MYCIYMYLKEETILAALFQQCSTKENMHTGSNSSMKFGLEIQWWVRKSLNNTCNLLCCVYGKSLRAARLINAVYWCKPFYFLRVSQFKFNLTTLYKKCMCCCFSFMSKSRIDRRAASSVYDWMGRWYKSI